MNVIPLHPGRTLSAESTHILVTTQHLRSARRLHVLDIENLCGTSHLTTNMVRYVLDDYRREVGIGPSDHVVVGVSHHNALAVSQVDPGFRLCVRSGVDGADLALLEVLGGEHIEERFERICLGTGDGLFSDTASALASRAVHVHVVAGFGTVARRLRMAAGTFTQLTFSAFTQEHA